MTQEEHEACLTEQLTARLVEARNAIERAQTCKRELLRIGCFSFHSLHLGASEMLITADLATASGWNEFHKNRKVPNAR